MPQAMYRDPHSGEQKKERRNLCSGCGCRFSIKNDANNKINWIGHYATPSGLFCDKCYKQQKNSS